MLYFDFDGTLVDVWQRFYHIFKDASRIPEISFEDYVQAKKQIVRDADVASHLGASLPEDYWTRKREMLEAPEYLAYDRLLLPAERICSFFEDYECRILTNRRNPEAFKAQLSALGLEPLLEKCVVLNPDNKKSKAQYLREKHPNEQVCLVGDAEAEAQAAETGAVRVVLVRTGLRTPESIPCADKCEIIDSVSDFMNAFKERV